MENNTTIRGKVKHLVLAPGYRFHPTDEELIIDYLLPKALNDSFSAIAVGETNFNKVDPWDLPKIAKMGEKEWYFFCMRERKYPTSFRTSRATKAGYWKATGKDKEIYGGKELIGMKKTLVFYTGRAPNGVKTDWVMHEYRLEGKYSKYNVPESTKNEWALSRVFNKGSDEKAANHPGLVKQKELQQPCLAPSIDSSPHTTNTKKDLQQPFLPPLMNSFPHTSKEVKELQLPYFPPLTNSFPYTGKTNKELQLPYFPTLIDYLPHTSETEKELQLPHFPPLTNSFPHTSETEKELQLPYFPPLTHSLPHTSEIEKEPQLPYFPPLIDTFPLDTFPHTSKTENELQLQLPCCQTDSFSHTSEIESELQQPYFRPLMDSSSYISKIEPIMMANPSHVGQRSEVATTTTTTPLMGQSMADDQFIDPISLQDEVILRFLLERKGSDMAGSSMVGLEQERGLSFDDVNADIPPISSQEEMVQTTAEVGSINLDCLWYH